MASVIKIKRGGTDPTAAQVTNAGELAANTTTPKVFLKTADDSATTPIWVGAQIEASPGDWSSTTKLATQSGINTTFMPKAGGTFTGVTSFGQAGTAAGEIRLLEDTDDGANYTAFRGSARAANITYVLPTTDPTAGQVLVSTAPTTNVATLSWGDASSATTVSTSSDDTNTTRYLVFSTTSGSGKTLYVDDATTALTYNPNTASLTLGGDVAVNGGDITTTAATTTIFNTGATTVSGFGAATTLTLGYNSTAASTTNISTGAVATETTKTMNIGTGGGLGSTTAITMGATTGDTTVSIGNGPNFVYQPATFASTLGNVNTISSFARSTSYPFLRISNGQHISATSGDNAAIDLYGSNTGTSQPKTCNILPQVSNSVVSNVNIGGAISGNTVKILGTSSGATTISSDVTTGTVNLFSAVTTGTVNLANAGSSIVEIGSTIRSSQTTANVFNTTATTVNVAGAGTTVSIGAATGTTTINNANTVVTGDLAVNGADITTSSTGTATVFNTNATTLNVGQAATAISMGATTGTTTVRNDVNLPTGKVYQINGTSVLSGSALGSGVTSSSLTSVGTIGTGVWQGTDIGVVYGGTGTSDGSITGTGALTFTAGGTNTNVNLVPLGSGTVDVGSKRITNLAAPSASTDAATRAYVDNVAQGLHVHAVAKGATTTTLATLAGVAVSYSGGTQAITWTGGTAVTSSFTDGVTFAANTTEASASRIVVKNEADVGGLGAAYNGIYYCYGARELRRTTDSNAAAEFAGGDFVFVTDGTTYNNTGWVQTEVVTTLDTDPIAFDQFSGAGTMIADEITLTKSGDTFSIKNTYIGQSSITTLGTIGTGIWNGTVIGLTYGGTGKALVAAAGGIVWSDADSLEITTAGTSGYVLTSGGTATPTWTNATDANTASAIVKRDASGNFTAGTMTGTASNASAVTMASSTDTTSYLAFVSDASATSQGLKYNSSLLYNATTNYLDANIDGGTY